MHQAYLNSLNMQQQMSMLQGMPQMGLPSGHHQMNEMAAHKPQNQMMPPQRHAGMTIVENQAAGHGLQ